MIPHLILILALAPDIPATQQAAADFWLDRAAGEIRSVTAKPTTRPADVVLEAATELVDARGNDADRELLRQMMNRPLPPKPEKISQAGYDFQYKCVLADAHRALGE